MSRATSKSKILSFPGLVCNKMHTLGNKCGHFGRLLVVPTAPENTESRANTQTAHGLQYIGAMNATTNNTNDKLMVDRNFRKPKMLPGESFAMFEKRIGAVNKIVTGGIGRSGEKVHKLILSFVETENGIGVLNVYNFCGSGRFDSATIPYFSTDLSSVNCKKCQR